jgi:hypothetical protein
MSTHVEQPGTEFSALAAITLILTGAIAAAAPA